MNVHVRVYGQSASLWKQSAFSADRIYDSEQSSDYKMTDYNGCGEL